MMTGPKNLVRHGFGGLPGWLIYMLAAVAFGGSAAAAVAGLSDDRMSVRAVSVTAVVVLGALALLCLTESVTAGQITVRHDGVALKIRPVLLPWAGTTIPLASVDHVCAVTRPVRPWRSFGWWRPVALHDVLLREGPALQVTLRSGHRVEVSTEAADQLVRDVSAWLSAGDRRNLPGR
jgi:hypothetical protein